MEVAALLMHIESAVDTWVRSTPRLKSSILVFLTLGWTVLAGAQTPSNATPASSNTLSAVTGVTQLPALGSAPSWDELSAEQKVALKPLYALWNTLGDVHRKKWLATVRNYAQLPAIEQQKMQERMEQWAKLTPLERERARDNFAAARKANPTDKVSKWQEYQALSPEQKEQLAKTSPTTPKRRGAAKLPKAPAAPPAVPTPVPSARSSPRHPPSPLEMHRLWDGLNPQTLLPLPSHEDKRP